MLKQSKVSNKKSHHFQHATVNTWCHVNPSVHKASSFELTVFIYFSPFITLLLAVLCEWRWHSLCFLLVYLLHILRICVSASGHEKRQYADLKNLKLKTIDPLGWILFRCFSKMSDSLHFAHFVNGDFNFKWIGSQAGLNGNPATQTYVILGKEVVGAATLSYWCLHSMWSCVFIFICNWRHCYDNDQGPERSRGF